MSLHRGMALKSFVIWNNKGGVGKSTLTFHLATRYAELHPTERVLVIDMCPQANASMMMLGGGTVGEAHALSLCQQQPAALTVVGYLATVLSGGPRAPLPPASSFLVGPRAVNPRMPSNVSLLCGDGNLELMAPLIAYNAA
ncbi:MAG: ParA family protein, partial [Polyangiales bacterium]